MSRPRKQTADYFPHYVAGRRQTIFVLETRWGNDGYAFWFKLLEQLCMSEGHFYDCSTKSGMQYLTAYTKVPEETAVEMIEVLVDREKIDRELWEQHRIIWCQTLVDNLRGLYSKRTVSIPEKPVFDGFTEPKTPTAEETEPETVPEEKPEEKPKRRKRQSELTAKQLELFEKFYGNYPKKIDRATAERAWAKINPDEEMTERIIAAVEEAKKHDSRFREKQFTPNPASWLNAKGYLNEYGGGYADDRSGGFKPSDGFRN